MQHREGSECREESSHIIADDVDDEHREAQERSAGNGTSEGCDRKYHHRYGVDDYYNIATQGAAQE